MGGGELEVWQRGDKFYLSCEESMTKMIDGELSLEEYYFPEERAKEIKVLISEEQV